MKAFTIHLTNEGCEQIKKRYGFKTDFEVERQLEYWVDLAFREVVLKNIIAELEEK